MSRPRIVVTGVGIISPLALSANAHFQALVAGHLAVERLDDQDYQNFSPILLARVKDYNRRDLIPDRMLRKLLSPSPAFALASAGETLADAGLKCGELTECGLFVGSVCLDANPEAFIPALRESIRGDEVDLSRFATHGTKLVDPLFLVKSLPNAGLCSIAIQHQVLGPNANITNGAVSGLQAVIAAMESLWRGEADFALAGGYDSQLRMDTIVDHVLNGRLASAGEEPDKACRPFDKRHSGYALSEGAAFLTLETEHHARKRSARIYAEMISFGETSLPANLVTPQLESAEHFASAACAAIEAGGCKPSAIDCVFGSGLATVSMGFPGAPSGVFSLVHAILSMRDGVTPPIMNCDQPLDELNLPLIREPRAMSINHALAWTSDHGIKNAAVLVARFRE